MKTYKSSTIDSFIKEYRQLGGMVHNIGKSVLTSGNWILYDPSGKLCNYIIKEVYLNKQSSEQSIRCYKKLPKKYDFMLPF